MGTASKPSQVVEELVASAASGDRQAQQALLTHYWPLISRAVRARRNRIGYQRDDTTDLEQRAALRVLQDLNQVDWRGESAFASWIARLATLEVIDGYRHDRAERRGSDRETPLATEGPLEISQKGPGLETRVDGMQQFEKLMEQIQALDPRQSTSVLMSHLGFSYQEIGETLDCSPEAARKLATRGRVKLTLTLGD